MGAGGVGAASDCCPASPYPSPRELSDSAFQDLIIRPEPSPLDVVEQKEVLAGSPGMGTQLLFHYSCGNPAALKEPVPVSLEVHRCLSHVSACEVFSVFHLGVPFLVPPVGAFPETPSSFSLFCYLTQEEELGTDDSHGNGREQMEEGS